MFRVLIVEDESVIRKGLIQSIHWHDLDLILVGEAENGRQALDILKTSSVDIILTDMRMPLYDGQHMLQEIERQKYDCEIIVLSEYSDFAYMRQAIYAHVFDYLLKPVSSEDLNDVFLRVTETLRKNKSAKKLPLDQLSALFSLVATTSQDNLHHSIKSFLSTHSDSSINVSVIFIENKIDLIEIMNCQVAHTPFESRIIALQPNHKYALLSLMPTPITKKNEYIYYSWLQSLCNETSIGPFRIGISTVKESLLQLPDALSEACSAASFMSLRKNYIEYHTVKDLILPQYSVPINERQMTELLKSGHDVRKEVKRIFYSTFEIYECIYLPAARRMLMKFTLSLERCCQEAGKGVNISTLIGGNYLDLINKIEWKHEFDSVFKLIVDKTFCALIEQDTTTTEGVLRRVLNAIQTNYMDNLSLIRFAQDYHINYIYLSRKFKELTGETFTNYLMQVRMNKAKHLIEQDGLSEKAAAPLVGYTNPYYFISSYRKYFNLEEDHNEK